MLLFAAVVTATALVLTGAVRLLPPGAAWAVSFAAWCAPGVLLALRAGTGSALESAAAGVAVTAGIVGLLSLPAFAGGWRLSHLGLVVAAAALALGAAAAVSLRARGVTASTGGSAAALVLLGLLLLAEVMIFRFRAASLRPDNYTYLAYMRQFLDFDRLGWTEPFFGDGSPMNIRMIFSFWLSGEALMSHWSGVDLFEAHRNFLSAPLLALVPLSSYYLAREVLRERWKALVAAGAQVLFFLLSLGRDMPGSVVFRIREDKVMASLVLFPAVMALTVACLRGGGRRRWYLLVLAAFGLGCTHPAVAAFYALGAGMFVAAELLWGRAPGRLRRSAGVTAAAAAAAVLPVVQKVLYGWESPALGFSVASAPAAMSRIRFRRLLVLDRESNLFLLHPKFLANALIVAALLAGLLLLLRVRKDPGARYLFSNLYGFALLVFTPGITALTGRIVTPWQLWRMVWVVPFSLALAYVAFEIALPLAAGRRRSGRGRPARLPRAPAAAAALALLVPAFGWYAAAKKPFPYELRPKEPVKAADVPFYRSIGEDLPAGSLLLMEGRFDRYLPAFTAVPRLLCYWRRPAVSAAGISSCRDRQEFFAERTAPARRFLVLKKYLPDYLVINRKSTAMVFVDYFRNYFSVERTTERRALVKVDTARVRALNIYEKRGRRRGRPGRDAGG